MAPANLHRACIIALTAMVAGPTAQADDTTLTLACQGTTQLGNKSEPVSMGIIVNFTNKTVQGFGAPGALDYPVKITASNDVTVAFLGTDDKHGMSIRGSIDRVTGDVEATSTVTDAKTSNTLYLKYALKCRPAQRMF